MAAKSVSKRRKRYVWTDDTPRLLTEAVLKLGTIEGACELVGMSKPFLYKHLKEDSELKNALTRARARHKKAVNPDQTDLYVKALESLESLLQERIRIYQSTTIKQLQNAEGEPIIGAYDCDGNPIDVYDSKGKQLSLFMRIEKENRVTVDPSMKAIEKVLGKKAIERVLAGKRYEDRLLNLSAPIAIQVLGRWADKASKEEDNFDNISLLSDVMDLFNLRLLQAETRRYHEAGELDIREFSDLLIAQTSVYQRIKHSMEQRYAKLMGGKSYMDLVQEFQTFVGNLYRTFNDVVMDESIERKNLVSESIDRAIAKASKSEEAILCPDKVRVD